MLEQCVVLTMTPESVSWREAFLFASVLRNPFGDTSVESFDVERNKSQCVIPPQRFYARYTSCGIYNADRTISRECDIRKHWRRRVHASVGKFIYDADSFSAAVVHSMLPWWTWLVRVHVVCGRKSAGVRRPTPVGAMKLSEKVNERAKTVP